MTQTCNTCGVEKPRHDFRMRRSGEGLMARCRSCYKRKDRQRSAQRDLTLPCPSCGELFVTSQGVGSHLRLTHGIRGKGAIGAGLAPKFGALMRGRNVDSMGAWHLVLAVWPKRRAA